jgi:hypothetical protein
VSESRKFTSSRFEAVDIRAVPDDELDDIVGGRGPVTAALKKE